MGKKERFNVKITHVTRVDSWRDRTIRRIPASLDNRSQYVVGTRDVTLGKTLSSVFRLSDLIINIS